MRSLSGARKELHKPWEHLEYLANSYSLPDMIFDLSELPSDTEQLKSKLFELVSAVEAISSEKLAVAAQLDAALLENEKLLFILAEFKRALYGRRSEKLDPDQLQLMLEMTEGAVAAASEGGGASGAAAPADTPKKPRKPARRRTAPIFR